MPFATLILAAAIGQAADPSFPATDDRASLFARRFLAFIKADPKKAAAVRRLPTAFFYGKAKLLMTFPQTRWEQAHLGVCRQMLDMLDRTSGQEIKRIQDAKPNQEIYHIAPADREMFDERFSVLMGYEDPQTSEIDKWNSSAGYALGSLAGHLVTWHYRGGDEAGRDQFYSALDVVAERAKNTPAGVDPALVSQMNAIPLVGRREKYKPEDLQMTARRIEAALNTIIPPGAK